MAENEETESDRAENTFSEISAKYLAVRSGARANCEAYTLATLPKMGERLPVCYRNIGVTLAMLDGAACCDFGCPGQEHPHRIHRLIGRCVSNGSASLSLALQGQYDESLLLTRNIGEIANLLLLFTLEPSEQAKWETLQGKEHWNEFRPKKIRDKIASRGQVVLMAEPEYGALSEIAVHAGPGTSPQALGLPTRPLLGAHYRGSAFVVCLNELASALAGVSLGAKLILDDEQFEHIATAAAALYLSVGSVRLGKLPQIWKDQLEALTK